MSTLVPSESDAHLAERLQLVRDGIAEACRNADRDIAEITTVVVTKFHPASVVRQLMLLGVHDFGENRHQEASAKAAELASLSPTWHFVGQLQSKKARAVREYARVVHSIDRVSLVDALAKTDISQAAGEDPLDCFVQLNLTSETHRGGVADGTLEDFAERVVEAPGLRLLGVMAVAPLGEEPRRAFARVRLASERIRSIAPEARFISAGMSADYADAILEGATHLRIGSAITGNRPGPG